MANVFFAQSGHRVRRGSALVWVIGSLALCILGLIVMTNQASRWFDNEAIRLRRDATNRQLDDVRSGKQDCLVEPEPGCVDSLLMDRKCKENIKWIYLGGDISDPRLARLAEVPKIDTVVLIYAADPETFLDAMSANASISSLQLEKCGITPNVMAAIRKMTMLKGLHVCSGNSRFDVLAALKGHPSLEQLSVNGLELGPGFVELMRSLPRLRRLDITLPEEPDLHPNAIMAELKKALPNCQIEIAEYHGK
jgi:hypothetical protein